MLKNYFPFVLLLSFFINNTQAQTTYVPDDRFENLLIYWGYDDVADDYVLTSNINNIEVLEFAEAEEDNTTGVEPGFLYDMTGIEDFEELKSLRFSHVWELENLDLSKNSALELLSFTYGTGLKNLILPINSSLKYFSFTHGSRASWENLDLSTSNVLTSFYLETGGGEITSLDFSNCPLLEGLSLTNLPNLVNLNLKNGNNTLLTHPDIEDNPKLICVQVDDAVWSTANWTIYDAWMSFSEDCNPTTAIPDANFEQALIDLGIDSDGLINQSVLTSDVSGVTSLDVRSKNISDLTGVEAFTSLTHLICRDNLLTSLDVSQNTALINLWCDYNQLTNLDVSQDTTMNDLDCSRNQITELDLSRNTALTLLDCNNNQLTGLDFSQNTALIGLLCYNNQLTSLNIKNGNNSLITIFSSEDNSSLTCMQVDDPAWSIANWTNVDSWTSFSEDCGYALGVDDELLSQAITFYPNPVTNLLSIDSEIPLIKVEIYSILGKKVKEINSDYKSIPTNDLSKGVYVVKMYSEVGMTTKKLIKR